MGVKTARHYFEGLDMQRNEYTSIKRRKEIKILKHENLM